MKKLLLLVLLSISLSTCCLSQNCPENINTLPMYGGVKKCKEQIEADRQFIALVDKQYSKREDAAKHMVQRGWEYLSAQKLDTSMMRFNQAWLLDSSNYQIYWGYGDLMGIQNKFKESLPYFMRSIQLNPNNIRLLQDASVGYGNTYLATKNEVYLDTCITLLKKAVKIEPANAGLYAQIAAAYFYSSKQDSTRKYANMTYRLDPKAVPPNLKKMVGNK
jgi:tetratricopeptide (TPR) repeat protein